MNDNNRLDRLVADLGQFQVSELYADKAYAYEGAFENDADLEQIQVPEEFEDDAGRRVITIYLDEVYRRIEREEGPDGERLRSGLARAIATANPVVANLKYLGCNVRIVKAVRNG